MSALGSELLLQGLDSLDSKAFGEPSVSIGGRQPIDHPYRLF